MRKIAKGLGVSSGIVEGTIRLIRDPDDHSKFKDGDILVTHLTDPSFVVLMCKAAGIICDIGGLTSHPSVVAREMGIPCIVSAKCVKTEKDLTEVIQDGIKIRMCGESGEIHSLEDQDGN